MEHLKELLLPNTFNKCGYVGVFLWAVIGVILLGVFAEMDNGERSDFRCKAKLQEMDFVRGKCFEEYDKRHNKYRFPVYGFVLINFLFIGIVGAVYSQVMKSTVDDHQEESTDAAPVDAERQRPPETHRLFVAYCCQLMVRFALGIVAMVLQTQLLYSSIFPSDFNCDLSSPAANKSAGKNSTTYECHNQRAWQKTVSMHAVVVVNGFFAVLIIIEFIAILILRVKRGKTFLKDSQFLRYYLHCGRTCAPQENPRQLLQQDQQVSQQEPPPLRPEHQDSPEEQLQQRPEQQVSLDETPQLPLQDQQEQLLSSFIKSLKKSIIKDTETLPDLEALLQANPGEGERIEDLKLDSIYRNLVLVPNRVNYDFSGNRQEQLKQYPMPEENLEPVRREDIIDDKNKKVLIVGRPGIGKRVFCTKFLRDWAKNETQDSKLKYELAFLIKFRRFNSQQKPLSLRKLLTFSEHAQIEHLLDHDQGWSFILKNPEKHLALTILKCLFETGENKESHSVVKSKLEEIGFNAVDFSLCDLAPSDCTAVVHVLKNVPQISCIDFSDNHIGSLGCVEIRKLLDIGNCQLTELILNRNNIDDNGVLELCKVITNSKLTVLDLSRNKITDVGVLELCKVITNSKLIELDLSMNKITDVGVLELCNVITNSKLTALHLS